jgi:hypothetical protein
LVPSSPKCGGFDVFWCDLSNLKKKSIANICITCAGGLKRIEEVTIEAI